MDTIDIERSFRDIFPDLARMFSLKKFQKIAVSNILQENNTLCIMPTGGGKSLIYWLSGLMLGGITVVISPLVALIDEQAKKIEEQGYEALVIHGGISSNRQVDILKKFSKGELNPDFIFVSPERVSMDGLFEYCIKQRKDEIKLVVIDEIHCVSQWGMSFRPFYKRISLFLNKVYGEDNWEPRLLGLTATLNAKEVVDICKEFKIERENIIKDDLLMRTEITLKVLKFSNENEKEEKFWGLLELHQDEKVLVYVYRKYHKRGVEELAEEALNRGYSATSFHGDMSSLERQEIINKYRNDEINIVFATNAFGMGIDIPDIEVVIHFMIPESVEQYYQEIGRAARDIDSANAYMLYTNKNVQVRRTHFIDKSFPITKELEECYNKITGNEVALKTLQYYSDDQIQKCLPYFLDNGLLKIKSKGISNLNIFSDIQSEELENIYNATVTRGTIATIKKIGIAPENLMNIIYSSILEDQSKLLRVLDKCLIVESTSEKISQEMMESIDQYIMDRKEYKHKLLDYLVYLLDEGISSIQLHQEIGRYLGVPKHNLNLIYSTSKGDKVRSKSEVIIANLLFQNSIKYEYEKRLYYNENDLSILPDFTIHLPDGREIYWEHLGMIGTEDYDKRWLKKLKIYNDFFPGMMVKTYEGASLTDAAISIINNMKAGGARGG